MDWHWNQKIPSKAARHSAFVTFGVMCAAGVLVGGYLGLYADPPALSNAVPPPLSVRSDKLDFGEVCAQPAFLYTVPIRNSSNHRVEVSNVLTSCSCSSVKPRSFVLEAGETVPLRVTLDLRKQSPASGQLTKAFQATIAAVVANSDSRIEWSLVGATKQCIEFTPESISLGQRSERQAPFPRQVVKVRALFPTRELKAKCTSEFFDVSVIADASVGRSTDEYKLEVVAKPASIGPVDCDLRVDAIAADGNPLPTFVVPVRGKVVRDVQPVRNRQSLGVLEPGASFQSQVELRSLSDSEFDISAVTCSGDGVLVEAEQGSATVYNVSGVVTGLGMQSIQVRFSVRHPDGVSYSVSVPIRYVAAAES